MNDKIPVSAFSTSEDQLRVLAENFKTLYANNLTLSISQWDVTINFGEILGKDENGKTVIAQHARVNMSKELAKVFRELLDAHISNYEEQFGEIRIPDMKLLDKDKLNARLRGGASKIEKKTKSRRPKS